MIDSFKRLSLYLIVLLVGNLVLIQPLAVAQNNVEPKQPKATEKKLDEQEPAEKKSDEKPDVESTQDEKAESDAPPKPQVKPVDDSPPAPKPATAAAPPDPQQPTQSEAAKPAEMAAEPIPDESAQAEQTASDESDLTAADEGELLKNGSFENQTDGQPDNWVFPPISRERGAVFKLDDDNPLSGKFSGLVDTTKADFGVENGFVSINQYPDPAQLSGKRIRFRAAVRADELVENGRAQLWLRVDRPRQKSRPVMGAFDNMANRPITSKEWEHYDIVADIDDDANRVTVGMLVIGKAKVWIDDASIEIVDDQTATTTGIFGSVAADAPQQPFFTAWLWLVLIVLVLFAVSQARNSFAQRFALRFSCIYWLLYCFPTLIVGIGGSVLATLTRFNVNVETASERLGRLVEGEKYYTGEAVQWVAANLFKMQGKLVLPNGSGDTTFAYIRVLICFCAALLVAIAWSSVYWRKQDQTSLRDLLRSYLRYVLALTMLGYGLHKAGFSMTQFAVDGVPSELQLSRTYGDSSPMGLLWTFMAASPAYTFFAGLGEVIGGLLLVFRRTATLGALVVFGVMLNVMMLNFCYDVPVKQYSFHLLVMALIVILPDLPRLANVLLWNRAAEPSHLLIPPYTNVITIWIHRLLKAVVVVLCVCLARL